MLCGKVRAAVRWLSDNNKGTVLPSTGTIDIKNDNGTSSSMTVLEAMKRKHPAPNLLIYLLF